MTTRHVYKTSDFTHLVKQTTSKTQKSINEDDEIHAQDIMTADDKKVKKKERKHTTTLQVSGVPPAINKIKPKEIKQGEYFCTMLSIYNNFQM